MNLQLTQVQVVITCYSQNYCVCCAYIYIKISIISFKTLQAIALINNKVIMVFESFGDSNLFNYHNFVNNSYFLRMVHNDEFRWSHKIINKYCVIFLTHNIRLIQSKLILTDFQELDQLCAAAHWTCSKKRSWNSIFEQVLHELAKKKNFAAKFLGSKSVSRSKKVWKTLN